VTSALRQKLFTRMLCKEFDCSQIYLNLSHLVDFISFFLYSQLWRWCLRWRQSDF